MITWRQLILQDAYSPIIIQLSNFHDHTIFLTILVITFIFISSIILSINTYKCRNINEAQNIEIVWTLLPGIILIFLALPSLRLLYLIDEINNPILTIKTIAHQWYWTYEYTDFTDIEFNSYIIPDPQIIIGEHRLLEVDNRLILPTKTITRILVTSADVIHSWTIPSLGTKIDAIPGRLNQISLFINYPCILYGQCSEICGANHSFIPISIEVINNNRFINWINKFN